jgi:hypothetical protein
MFLSFFFLVQTFEEQKRTEALGEKLFTLLKDRPRHRALLTNECKLNMNTNFITANFMANNNNNNNNNAVAETDMNNNDISMSIKSIQNQQQLQEDETYYTRELIQIYGQPIVPSFHKQFNYQLSNTHYGYRTLRRLLNCDILKSFVKITKEEIKSLDRRLVEFVQLTEDKCMQAFQINLTCFYDASRFENGIIKNWLDVWYVDRLKEKYNFPLQSSSSMPFLSQSSQYQPSSPSTNINSNNLFINSSPDGTSNSLPRSNTTWSLNNLASNFESTNFFHTSNCSTGTMFSAPVYGSECDETNHLWFCLRDYSCTKMDEFLGKLKDYVKIFNNRSELILVHTAYPIFEYKHILTETRRLLALFLNKFTLNKSVEEMIDAQKFPVIAKQHIFNLLNKFLNVNDLYYILVKDNQKSLKL